MFCRPEYMHMKNDPSIHYEHSNHSATSSEEQMLQMFSQNYDKPAVHSVSPPSPSLPMPVSSAPCSTETICAKPPYTSPSNQQPSNSNHIDDEDEPRRKRMCEVSKRHGYQKKSLFRILVRLPTNRVLVENCR